MSEERARGRGRIQHRPRGEWHCRDACAKGKACESRGEWKEGETDREGDVDKGHRPWKRKRSFGGLTGELNLEGRRGQQTAAGGGLDHIRLVQILTLFRRWASVEPTDRVSEMVKLHALLLKNMYVNLWTFKKKMTSDRLFLKKMY